MIKARVDSIEGNFILDTGAPGLVLNITYFRNYPQTVHDAEQTSITGTSSSTVAKTTVSELNFGTYHYYKAEADLLNLGHIENTKNIKILGLLGMGLFKQFEMIIDYEQGLIYLHHISKKEASDYKHVMLQETDAYSTLPIEIIHDRIVVQSEMAGKKLKFVIDCAAETNILDSRLPNKIFDQVTITRKVTLTGSGNKKIDALYGNMADFKIGGDYIKSLPVLITNLENTCFANMGCVDGVLGFDFLSLHKVGFNFVTRKMYIWK